MANAKILVFSYNCQKNAAIWPVILDRLKSMGGEYVVIGGFQEVNESSYIDMFTLRCNEFYQPIDQKTTRNFPSTGRDNFHYVESDNSTLCVSKNVTNFERFYTSNISISAASFNACDNTRHAVINVYFRPKTKKQDSIIALTSLMNIFLKLKHGGDDNAGQSHQ